MCYRILLASLSLASCSHAADDPACRYPNRPIRLHVPYPPGWRVGRRRSHRRSPLSAALGQQVLIDNRGAGGFASSACARAFPRRLVAGE